MRDTFASPALRQYGLTTAALLPPAVLAVLIVQHWVNVPLLDEWDVPGQLLKEYFGDGHLRWATLFAQHNESRILFPQLIFLLAAILFGWDTRVPQTLVWICAVAMFMEWVWLARRTFQRLPFVRWGVLAVMSAVFFSTNQWESWLWGIQLQVFLPPLCLITCLVVQQSRLPYSAQMLLCVLLAFVSTYSNANGMLCWLLGFPVRSVPARGDFEAGADLSRRRRERVGWLAAYSGAAVFCIVLYFRHYARPGQHPPVSEAFRRPLAFAEYFIGWVGNPFCRGLGGDPLHFALVLGLLTLAAIFAASALVMRNWTIISASGVTRRLHPWVIIMLYGLLSGLITTAGRLSFGLEQAISTRYISFACYVIIGLIGSLAALPSLCFPRFAEPRSRWYFWAPFVAVLGICFACNWWNGFRAFEGHRIEEEKMKLALELLPLIPDNPALAALYPVPSRIREVAGPLFERGVLRHATLEPWPFKVQEPKGNDEGWFMVQAIPGGNLVSGCSILLDRRTRPRCVFIARSTDVGDEDLVTAAPLAPANVLHGATSLFIRSFSLQMPKSPAAAEGSLRVYSVDLGRQRALRLRERSPAL